MTYVPTVEDAKNLLEHASDGILLLARDGTIVYANAQAERLYRRKASTLVDEPFWTLAAEARTAEAQETLERALERNLPGRFEIFHPGLYAWHAVTVVPSSTGAVLYMRDVTDRMRLLRDDAVRQGIADLVSAIPVAISMTRGPEHRFEVVNSFARELLKGRDVVGQTLRNAFPELVEQGFIDLFDRVYTTGEPFTAKELDAEFRRGTDEVPTKGIFDVVYKPLRDLNGEITGVLSVSVDVTEQVQARRDVEAMAREREAVLEQLSEGVVIADREGRIRHVNELARALHGRAELDVPPEAYSAAYSLLTESGEPFPPADLPLARAVVQRERVRNARWVIQRPDGSRILVEGNATPVSNADGSPGGAVLTLHAVGTPQQPADDARAGASAAQAAR